MCFCGGRIPSVRPLVNLFNAFHQSGTQVEPPEESALGRYMDTHRKHGVGRCPAEWFERALPCGVLEAFELILPIVRREAPFKRHSGQFRW